MQLPSSMSKKVLIFGLFAALLASLVGGAFTAPARQPFAHPWAVLHAACTVTAPLAFLRGYRTDQSTCSAASVCYVDLCRW